MALEILTDNEPRELVTHEDLPKNVREDFDYVTGEDCFSPRFVEFNSSWYDTGDMMRADLKDWDGICSETYFSGVLFRFVEDGECVICGSYYS